MSITFQNHGVRYQLLSPPLSRRAKEAKNAELMGELPQAFNASPKRPRTYQRLCRLAECREPFETTNRVKRFCARDCQQRFEVLKAKKRSHKKKVMK